MTKPRSPRQRSIATLRRQGLTDREIGAALGFSRQYVHQLLPSGRGPGRRPISDDVSKRIRALRSEGRTMRAIAADVGVSLASVAKMLGAGV